jgi:hypothetical protein
MTNPVSVQDRAQDRLDQEPTSDRRPSARRLLRWVVKYSPYAAAAASALWTGLLVLVAKNEINLVVWVDKPSTIYPSEASTHHSLPLTFEGTPARSVRTAAVKISNYGKTTIGAPAGTWNLIIEAPKAGHLRMISDPKVRPAGTVVIPRDQPRPNALAFEIGAFQPRASIDTIVLLVNDGGAGNPVFRATPTLGGLPREVSLQSPQEKVQERLYPAVFVLVFLLACFGFGPAFREDFRRMRGKPGPEQGTEPPGKPRSIGYLAFYFSSTGVMILILVALAAAAASFGLAYIVSYTL